jgi:hypothetical protein
MSTGKSSCISVLVSLGDAIIWQAEIGSERGLLAALTTLYGKGRVDQADKRSSILYMTHLVV